MLVNVLLANWYFTGVKNISKPRPKNIPLEFLRGTFEKHFRKYFEIFGKWFGKSKKSRGNGRLEICEIPRLVLKNVFHYSKITLCGHVLFSISSTL